MRTISGHLLSGSLAVPPTLGDQRSVFLKGTPKSLNGKKLPAGLSGGVSLLGTIASFAGSGGIVLLLAICLWLSGQPLSLTALIWVLLLGFVV